eukprot:TRINITY_DN20_c0_g1_i1.p2 TRINITY_DN20_c0_g1~~TRINITY_DN20_c0_g1_i1.p2  ORF type:complete len:215 (-),score=24.79 TRINITY_DN20_c0_g1_i1:542-1186(-)
MSKFEKESSNGTSSTPSSGGTVAKIHDGERHYSRLSSAFLPGSLSRVFTSDSKASSSGKLGFDSKEDGKLKASSKESGEAPRAKLLVRSRVEPKVFFANERTFLSWMGIAILIIFTSLSLLAVNQLLGGGSTSDRCKEHYFACRASQMAGVITAPMGLIIMAYALRTYRKRTFSILRRDLVRIDDQCGPTVLTVLLIVIMTVAYVLTMIGAFEL